MSYYYLTPKGEQRGPIEIHEFAAHGVNAQTMVWRQGMPTWKPAGSCPELSGHFAGAASAGNIPQPPTPPSPHVNEDGVKRPGNNLLLNIASWVLACAAFLCAMAILLDGSHVSVYTWCDNCNSGFPTWAICREFGVVIVLTSCLMTLQSAAMGILSLVKSGKARQHWQAREYDKMEGAASAGKLLAFIGLCSNALYFLLLLVSSIFFCC